MACEAGDSTVYHVPGEHVYEGMRLSKEVTVESLEKIRNYSGYVDGDVLLATYLKTGTTWMKEIVDSLLDDNKLTKGDDDSSGAPPKVPQSLYLELDPPFPPFMPGIDQLETLERPFFVKSHCQGSYFEKGISGGKLKTILVLRNPKDTLVSLYHFYLKNIMWGPFKGTFDEFFELYRARQLFMGDYFDWCDSWEPYFDNPKVLLVTYEDMKRDVREVIRKVASFLGKDCSDERVQAIADHTAFDTMKARYIVSDKKLIEKPKLMFAGNQEMIDNLDNMVGALTRKGTVGDWKNYFSPEQSRTVDEEYNRRWASKPFELCFEFDEDL